MVQYTLMISDIMVIFSTSAAGNKQSPC